MLYRFRGEIMPKLTVEGLSTVDVPQGKRLVNALTDEAKIDQLHACGGTGAARLPGAICFRRADEDDAGGEAGADRRGLISQANLRLSCQIQCEQDMTVRAISRLAGSGRKDAGAATNG